MKTRLAALLAIACVFGCSQEQGPAAMSAEDIRKAEAVLASHLHQLHIALRSYMVDQKVKSGAKSLYPDSISDLRPYVSDLDGLLVHPVTKEKTGIRYIKPASDAEVTGTTVMFAEERGGQVVAGGWVCYFDGGVAKAKKPANP